jgi:hypothetical protein
MYRYRCIYRLYFSGRIIQYNYEAFLMAELGTVWYLIRLCHHFKQ